MLIAAGIDIGSISTKAVLFDEITWFSEIRPTGWSPRQTAMEVYDQLLKKAGVSPADVSYVIGTGYGRISLPFINKAVSEITCHARGAHFLVKGTDMVIDIGGQHSKAITTDGAGNVTAFVMNDKCAAGTGRFLQVMATALDTEVSELAELSRFAEPVQINSMCAVFAESEVVSLLAQGVEKGGIIAGIHRSVALRVATMAEKLGKGSLITFTGGVAKNSSVQDYLSKELGQKITVVPESQLAGALGAAILAMDSLRR